MYKRFFDLIVSFFCIVLFSPVFLIIFLLVRFESPGKALFIQERVGQNLDNFKMYKFRTMFSNQSSHGDIKNYNNLIEARENYKITEVNDPRITRLGSFLRKFHLDELPQFVNVFMGDMSIVGPRPDVPAQQADYSNQQWVRRHKVKPGITGLSQIYASNKKFSHNLRIALDIKYSKKYSVVFDMYLILKTLFLVIKGKSF